MIMNIPLSKLKVWSRLILKKYQPTIIIVIGPSDRTSLPEAIAFVLRDKFKTRTSRGKDDNELSFAAAIIGLDYSKRNSWGWFPVLLRVLFLFLFRNKNYPRVLILKIDANQPEEITNLIKIAPLNAEIITVYEKKRKIIINNKALTLTYGLEGSPDLLAQDIVHNFTKGKYELSGLNFKLNHRGSIVPVFMDNIISETGLYATLAAAAIGVYFKMNLIEIAQALREYSLPKGQMNILPGIKHTFIIDDTYDSSPETSLIALDTLSRVKIDESASKYAILGDIAAVGNRAEEEHRRLGAKIADSGINYLIAVGEKSRDIIRGAAVAGLTDDYIFYFDHTEEAGRFLQNRLKAGDVVLIKGSSDMKMERIVKEIMAEPDRAGELLARQEE